MQTILDKQHGAAVLSVEIAMLEESANDGEVIIVTQAAIAQATIVSDEKR